MNTSNVPTAVAEYLTDNRGELFEVTETLVGYDTQNPPGRTVDVVGWLENALDEPAVSVGRLEVDPEKPNLVATLPGQTDRTLCFNGHLVPFRSTGATGRTIRWGSETANASTAAGRPR